MHSSKVEEILFQPDWQSYPAVVIESDDWGACEAAPDEKKWEELNRRGLLPDSVFAKATLETASHLSRLERCLQSYRNPDGTPAVLTAFACVANPDYAAIKGARFARYVDHPIDLAFPSGWERFGLREAWTQAMEAGVFHPEFHTRLHHTQPYIWLKQAAQDRTRQRDLFDHGVYQQISHLPEYQSMTPAEQHEWVQGAVEIFSRWTGRRPFAAVSSDATPVTEIIWRANGIRTFCLRNLRNERGEILVYANKPWNNQSVYTPMGGWNADSDMVYLRRNVDFECAWKVPSVSAIIERIQRQWDSNEPAILNCHRVNLVSLDQKLEQTGWENFEGLVERLSHLGHVRFLTSSEVGDLYRKGWSARSFGNHIILRALKASEGILQSPVEGATPKALGEGKLLLSNTPAGWHFQCPPGDYLLKFT